jgi:ribonuclease VapC
VIQDAGFQIEHFTAQHLELAREALPAMAKAETVQGSNYGDCFSYALAKATGLPLLFKGEDFQKRTCWQRWPTLEQGIKPHTVP